ncbi:MAG: hypothetical protein ABSA77_07960 [Thermoguttaceae bacterium]
MKYRLANLTPYIILFGHACQLLGKSYETVLGVLSIERKFY